MNRRQCRAGCPGTSSGSQVDEVAVQTRDVGRAERANVGGHDILRAVGRAHGVDYSALNCVRRPADVLQAQRRVAQQGATTPVIAKLEHPEALDHLDAILASADGVMIARGDPGVELPLERVLRIQKHIIQRATDAGVLVITHPRPTRAAASDVANAVLDRTDVVLRSGETAVGQYPVAVVAPESEKDLAAIPRELTEGPLLANMLEGGRTPFHAASELDAMGYRMVIYPNSVARAVAHAIELVGRSLKEYGTTEPVFSQMWMFDKLVKVLGVEELTALDERFAEEARAEGQS